LSGYGGGAEANGGGGVSVGNKANGVGGVYVINEAVGVGAGNTISLAVGAGKASFVPKTNSSIAARAVWVFCYSSQRSHDFLKQSAVLFARMRQVDRFAFHTVAACSKESAIACFW